MMEGMDGLALCQWIKNTFEYCHIPVILLTAKHGDSSRIEGYNSGADGYITKPFSFQVLQARIDNLLKQQDLRSSRYRNQVVIEVETDLDTKKTTEEKDEEAQTKKRNSLLNYHLGPADIIRIQSSDLNGQFIIVRGTHKGSQSGDWKTEIEVRPT